ncbi:LOW QUALITY PROTEIN: hypothetical protein PHMEG_00034159, partial [Phytophthora megakarya]
MTEPLAGTMPNLNTKLECTKNKKHYGLFDFIKGFWQLPLAKNSQEILSYETDEGAFTPTRVPQGSCDAAIHFQATMEKCFHDMLYESRLIWIDVLLVFAESIDEYLRALEKLFATMNIYGLKFSAMKTQLYRQTITWCGRVISADGISHDPKRIDALTNMPAPSSAAELQQFICASNWMRDSLVDYARTIQPLQQRLDTALSGNRKTKRVAAGILLTLDSKEIESFNKVKALLKNSAQLTHPKDEATLCLFVMHNGWAAIVTQVVEWQQDKTITKQNHELLICKGGTFSGAQCNWSITEKEAFPIVSACDNLNYMLLRPGGFRIYCDHRNLIYLFAPKQELKKHVKGKLLRWSLKLSEYRYTIAHIDGQHNLWADLISRWGGATHTTILRFKRITRMQSRVSKQPLIRPLDKDAFVWPTLNEIAATQKAHVNSMPRSCSLDVSGIYRCNGKVWIPGAAKQLVQRLFVISHCGQQGHRGEAVMMNHLKRIFFLDDITQRARRFLRRESVGTSKYLLIIKDNFSHFTELIPCDAPVTAVAAEAMLWWHSRYGVPETWISDNATHFKSEVLALLSKMMKAKQEFVVAYSPWLNGSVERVNRDVLQVLRVMILDYGIASNDWVYLIPLVQANINHSP